MACVSAAHVSGHTTSCVAKCAPEELAKRSCWDELERLALESGAGHTSQAGSSLRHQVRTPSQRMSRM